MPFPTTAWHARWQDLWSSQLRNTCEKHHVTFRFSLVDKRIFMETPSGIDKLSNRILSAKLPKIHVAWTAIDASTNSWHSSHATWELQKHPSRHPLDPPGRPSGSWRPIIVEKIVKLCAFRLSNLVKLHLTHLITKIRQKWLGINLFKGKW